MTDEEKPKRQRRNRNPRATTRLNDLQLRTFDEIFGPGFSDWYRRTHDADGKVLPEARIAGLQPPEDDKEH